MPLFQVAALHFMLLYTATLMFQRYTLTKCMFKPFTKRFEHICK